MVVRYDVKASLDDLIKELWIMLEGPRELIRHDLHSVPPRGRPEAHPSLTTHCGILASHIMKINGSVADWVRGLRPLALVAGVHTREFNVVPSLSFYLFLTALVVLFVARAKVYNPWFEHLMGELILMPALVVFSLAEDLGAMVDVPLKVVELDLLLSLLLFSVLPPQPNETWLPTLLPHSLPHVSGPSTAMHRHELFCSENHRLLPNLQYFQYVVDYRHLLFKFKFDFTL